MAPRSRVARSTIATIVGALACASAPTAAQAWSSPLTIPAARSGETSALAVGRDGDAIVVWGTEVRQGSPGTLTIDVVRARDGKRTRWEGGPSLILDTARSAAGDVDVLVQEGSASPYRLVLFRAGRDGRVRRVWSTKTHISPGGFGTKAQVARRGSRVAVAWLAARSGKRFAPVRLRLATGSGGAMRTHTVDGVLPRWVDNHLGYVHSSDLAIDASGASVIAFTARRMLTRKVLVLATIAAGGRVRTRQLSPGVEGLVTMRATPSARIGVLVEDTGITDDFGECIADPTPRRLSAAIRERGARTFGVLALLATPPYSCYDTQGRLVTGPDDRLAVLWGVAPEAHPALLTVQLATAPAGQPFAPATTLATGLLLRAAAFDASAINVAMTRPPGEAVSIAGPLFVQRFGLGSPGPLQPLDDAYIWRVMSDADPGGRVALAWRRGPSRDLLLSTSSQP